MPLQDTQITTVDGRLVDTSQMEMAHIAVGDEQHVMDVEQVELTTAELVATQDVEAEIVNSTEMSEAGIIAIAE